MCVDVSSIIFLILLPPRPMMYEWSVYEMSIFMITRHPFNQNKCAANQQINIRLMYSSRIEEKNKTK